MKAFITGITGMIGKHLAQVQSKNGVEVAGLSRATSASRYLKGDSKFHHYAGDILDRNFLSGIKT